jgi:NADH dehydrogenase FAD-containing subunit
MLDALAPKADKYKLHFIGEYIRKHSVPVYLNSRCLEIIPGKVRIACAGGRERVLDADTVVLAAGYRAAGAALEDAAHAQNIPCVVIGDAKEPRLAIDAIKEAYDCAYAL